MNEIYLSPAFARRTDEELELLRTIDGTTGFSLFWLDVVKPLITQVKAKRLLEIGAFEGEHTRLLLQYCDSFDATLTVIEPAVTPSLRKAVDSSARARLLAQKSRAALPLVDAPVDVVLLEGDLNYYTTYADLWAIRELSERQKAPYPVVLVRSTSCPYAKRDMYYDRSSIPAAERHDYAVSGMTPWSSELEEGMINFPFANASQEGGPRNGVLTAVEDFIEEQSGLRLRLFSLPVNNGLGIIYAEGSQVEEFVRANLLAPPALRRLLETCELARLNDIVRRLRPQQIKQDGRHSFRSWLKRKLLRLS